MLQTYETIYILQPELTEEEVDTSVGVFEEVLKENKADLQKTEKWGKKRLAYRVRKHWEGFYVLMEYNAEAATVNELERRLRIHDNVIKWMSVRKDPRAAAEEERRAARMAKAQAQREGASQGDSDRPSRGDSDRPSRGDSDRPSRGEGSPAPERKAASSEGASEAKAQPPKKEESPSESGKAEAPASSETPATTEESKS